VHAPLARGSRARNSLDRKGAHSGHRFEETSASETASVQRRFGPSRTMPWISYPCDRLAGDIVSVFSGHALYNCFSGGHLKPAERARSACPTGRPAKRSPITACSRAASRSALAEPLRPNPAAATRPRVQAAPALRQPGRSPGRSLPFRGHLIQLIDRQKVCRQAARLHLLKRVCPVRGVPAPLVLRRLP
jgi:hypothetical protein